MAKPSKKAKINKPVEDPKEHDLEQQLPESEASFPNLENLADEPPPIVPEASVDPVNIDSSGAKPPSLAKPVEEAEDVVVTGTNYNQPGNPMVLAKHSAEEEFLAAEKGKWKLDLESYAQFNAQEIHAGYQNRLHNSRDFEAGLVNLMKESFEVSTNKTFSYKYISVSRQVC